MDVTFEPTDEKPIVNLSGSGKKPQCRVDGLEIELVESLLKISNKNVNSTP